MSGGHHPRCAIQRRTEIVSITELGLPRHQPHAHGQLQYLLRGHRSVDSGLRRPERGTDAVAGVLEQETVVLLDRHTQHVIVDDQRGPHIRRVGLPPTGRTLDIGEQKRHDPRRRVPRGHSHRIAHRRSSAADVKGPDVAETVERLRLLARRTRRLRADRA